MSGNMRKRNKNKNKKSLYSNIRTSGTKKYLISGKYFIRLMLLLFVVVLIPVFPNIDDSIFKGFVMILKFVACFFLITTFSLYHWYRLNRIKYYKLIKKTNKTTISSESFYQIQVSYSLNKNINPQNLKWKSHKEYDYIKDELEAKQFFDKLTVEKLIDERVVLKEKERMKAPGLIDLIKSKKN